MAQQQGANVKILIDTETTYGTTPGTPASFVQSFVSENLQLKRNLVASKSMRSARNPLMPVRGRQDVSGTLNFEISPQMGRLLKHIFGGYTVSGASAPYTHTWKIGALPAGMCMEKQFTDLATAEYFLYNGVRVNMFKFSAKDADMLNCSVDLIGAKETVNAGTFHGSPTDLGHTPFDGMAATLQVGGSGFGTGVSVDFTLDNNLDGNQYAIGGAGTRVSLPAGIGAVTGKLTAIFDSVTQYNIAIANTETSLQIDLTNGSGTGGSAGNEKLSFIFQEIKFSPASPVVQGPTGLQVDLNFIAFYDNGAAASAVEAILLTPQPTF